MATHALSLDGYGIPAHSERDPVLDAILCAPLSQTPETDEERAAFEPVMASVGTGPFVSAEEITATIATMWREAGRREAGRREAGRREASE